VIDVSPTHIYIIANNVIWKKDINLEESEHELKLLQDKYDKKHKKISDFDLIKLKKDILKAQAKIKTYKGEDK
jgi:F0F1-type ATP synthase epsilon subunit